jgi:hypothetical protein
MAKKPADPVKLNLRFTEGLRARLEKQALKNNHSLNAEIVQRLERSFEQADRIAIFRETMEKRIEDLRHLYEESLAAFRKQMADEQAIYEKSVQDFEKSVQDLERKNVEFHRKIEEAMPAAAVVDVLLGRSELKSNLLRLIALKLADVPEDRLVSASDHRRWADRVVAKLKNRQAVEAKS